jgi:hypothetical protein
VVEAIHECWVILFNAEASGDPQPVHREAHLRLPTCLHSNELALDIFPVFFGGISSLASVKIITHPYISRTRPNYMGNDRKQETESQDSKNSTMKCAFGEILLSSRSKENQANNKERATECGLPLVVSNAERKDR